jgi:phospholipase D1/2
VVTYAIGRAIGRGAVERFGGVRVQRWNRDLARHGVLAVAALRLLPIAPYGAVNLMAGASAVGLRQYTLGTALGMAPGILALTVFGRQLGAVVARPEARGFGWLGALAIGLAGSAIALRRMVRRWAGSAAARPSR